MYKMNVYLFVYFILMFTERYREKPQYAVSLSCKKYLYLPQLDSFTLEQYTGQSIVN